MAARLKPRHQDDIRAKIGVITIIQRLQSHVHGKNKMSATQVQAANILLNKTISNAPQITEVSGPGGGPQEHLVAIRPQMTREEWIAEHLADE